MSRNEAWEELNPPPESDIKDNWEQRTRDIIKQGVLLIDVDVDGSKLQELLNSGEMTHAEVAWLGARLRLVEKAATKMAENMLKGVLKYRNQGRSLESWFEHSMDDLTDAYNYAYLLKESWDEEKAATAKTNLFRHGTEEEPAG